MGRKVFFWLLAVFLLLSLSAGALYGMRPWIMEQRRLDQQAQLLDLMERGATRIDLTQLVEIPGEEDAFPEFSVPSEDGLTAFAVLEIPARDLTMPVVVGDHPNARRASLAWWPRSAEVGADGLCVIYGHTLKSKEWPYNRLDQLKQGDEVCLRGAAGQESYFVRKTEVVKAESLLDTLAALPDGLALVADIPAQVSSHRLVVYAEADMSVG